MRRPANPSVLVRTLAVAVLAVPVLSLGELLTGAPLPPLMMLLAASLVAALITLPAKTRVGLALGTTLGQLAGYALLSTTHPPQATTGCWSALGRGAQAAYVIGFDGGVCTQNTYLLGLSTLTACLTAVATALGVLLIHLSVGWASALAVSTGTAALGFVRRLQDWVVAAVASHPRLPVLARVRTACAGAFERVPQLPGRVLSRPAVRRGPPAAALA